ncbi:hypothetical protein [uncultured Sphingomonas sp.]|uniref:hypothetical protein n=1 Tax=uncultured Sphingomonas sp. TaxID=158754 RepID=UPI0015766BC1
MAQSAGSVQATPATVLVVQRPQEVVSGSALPSNSEIWLSLDHELNSKIVKQGDIFAMTVSRDVMLGNYIVLPRGTPAHGQVSYRTGKGAFGKSGKLEFDLVDVQLPGRTIPIAGHYRIEGQGNTGATVGALVAVGVFSAFVKGHSASATQGSEWKGATKEPLIVSFNDKAQEHLETVSANATVPKPEPVPSGAAPATVVKGK